MRPLQFRTGQSKVRNTSDHPFRVTRIPQETMDARRIFPFEGIRRLGNHEQEPPKTFEIPTRLSGMDRLQPPFHPGWGIASACKTFGGISIQLTHLGTALNLAITENATIATTYDMKVRTYANELSKFRTREKDITNLLNEEGRRIKHKTRRPSRMWRNHNLRTAQCRRQTQE